MPFVPNAVISAYVLTFNNTPVLPQHQSVFFDDPVDRFTQRLTIYTGELGINLSADGAMEAVFQYPVLGTFGTAGGGSSIGIVPINDVVYAPGKPQFRSAIANFAITHCNVEATPAWLDVNSVAADLYSIELDSRDLFDAVVLSGRVIARNAVLATISYRVSVLERFTPNNPVRPPILIRGASGWTGNYMTSSAGFDPATGTPLVHVGPVKRPGIPQE